MKEIVYNYQYTEEDLLKFLTWQLYVKSRLKLFQYFFLVLFIFLIVLFILLDRIDFFMLGLFIYFQ